MNHDFRPFVDDTSRRMGDLTIENSEDRVSVYGSIDLTRDKIGLSTARDLKMVIDAIVASLSNDTALPDVVAIPPIERRPNPLL
ncbi:hypothetical protein [Sphingomonas oryzagri]